MADAAIVAEPDANPDYGHRDSALPFLRVGGQCEAWKAIPELGN